MRVLPLILVLILIAGFVHADSIENAFLRFTLDRASGAYTLEAKAAGAPDCTGSLDGMVTDDTADVRTDTIACTSGGRSYTFTLDAEAPFLLVSVFRASVAPEVLSGSLETPVFLPRFDATLNEIRLLGCDGLTEGTPARASYTFLAAAGTGGRGGVVAGWLTQNRASGIVLSETVEGKAALYGRAEYGLPRHLPGPDDPVEVFAVGLFADPLDGLEAYGTALARTNGIVLDKPIPSGYCTWYSDPHGGASDEKHLAELADFWAANLAPYGFDIIQIDDRWQAGRMRPKASSGPRLGFLAHHPKGPYRNGMKSAADPIRTLGMTPGLWFIPFAGDPENEPAASHPEWFVKTASGDPYYVYWAGWSLDMTHPGARAYLTQVTHRITDEWGFKYIKVDGLWAGMATTCLYPEPEYREDDLGGAVFDDPNKTNIEAYRDGLALLREAAGNDVFILGCNIAQNMRTLGASIGGLDGMRVGRDIGANWDHILPCVEMGSRLYFLHNRVWYNDPDCLMLREPLTLDQARAWASWIAVTGQMNLVSEWLPGLPPERLDLVKRSMPNHGMHARPLDLFETPTPRTWLLSKGEGTGARHVLALFNWDAGKEAEIRVPLDAIGNGPFFCFEYWSNIPVAPASETLECTLPPASCKVVALRPVVDHPCVLSTSRHITQGMIDFEEEYWDAATRTLSGVSRVVGGDPYDVHIALPQPSKYSEIHRTHCDQGSVSVLGVEATCAKIRLYNKNNVDISWQIAF